MTDRRPPASSLDAAVQAAADALLPPIQPPAHVTLSAADEPYWTSIILSRARREWIAVDLVLAAQLACTQSDLARESAALSAEGPVVANRRGTLVVNPRSQVVDMLTRRQLMLMRALNLSAGVRHFHPVFCRLAGVRAI